MTFHNWIWQKICEGSQQAAKADGCSDQRRGQSTQQVLPGGEQRRNSPLGNMQLHQRSPRQKTKGLTERKENIKCLDSHFSENMTYEIKLCQRGKESGHPPHYNNKYLGRSPSKGFSTVDKWPNKSPQVKRETWICPQNCSNSDRDVYHTIKFRL